MKETFTKIYENNTWGSEGSRSGPGSTVDRAKTVGKVLLEVVEKYSIRSLLDAPCGDFMWMKELKLPLESYVGVDIVEQLIENNKSQFEDPVRSFSVCDLSRESLPRSDLILCRDCLVHFSFADIFRTLRNFRSSGSRYLLTTTFRLHAKNSDIETGGWRPINLSRSPFCLPLPLENYPDWCPEPQYRDKTFALWDLQTLENLS